MPRAGFKREWATARGDPTVRRGAGRCVTRSTGGPMGAPDGPSGPVNGGTRRVERGHNRRVNGASEDLHPTVHSITSRAAIGLYLFCCLAYWVFYVAAVLLSSKYSFVVAARWALIGILPDCLLAPMALVFSRRVPWGSVAPWSFVLRHAAGGAAFIGASCAGYA